MQSGRLAVIVAEHAAEPFSSVNASVQLRILCDRRDQLVVQSLMIPFNVMMHNKFADGPAQRRLAQ